jgi:hypothetical protein
VQVRDIVERLNELLESERAGVETMSRLIEEATTPEIRALFEQIRDDEAWSCAGLLSCMSRDFAEKSTAAPSLPDRLRLLNRGQRWVVKRLEELLARPLFQESRAFLKAMRAAHVRNVGRCDDLIIALDRERELGPDPHQSMAPLAAAGSREAAEG